MDLIKRQLDMVIIAATALVLTFVLLFFIVSTTREVKRLEKEVEVMQTKEGDFLKSDYRLDLKNKERAETNRKMAEDSLKALRDQLTAHYRHLDFTNHNTTAPDFKRNLQNRTEGMRKNLEIRQIAYPVDHFLTRSFDFDHFLKPQVMANPTEIALVHKQLAIYDELIQIIARSGVQKIDMLKFRGDPKSPVATDRELFTYITYEVTLTGDIEAIQRFTRELNESDLLFVVRKSTLVAKDLKSQIVIPTLNSGGNPTRPQTNMDDLSPVGPGPGVRPRRPQPTPTPVAVPETPDATAAAQLPKNERLIFRELNSVTQTMLVDFVEFKKQ